MKRKKASLHQLLSLAFITPLLCYTNSHAIEITPFFGFRGGGELIDNPASLKYHIDSSDIRGLIISVPYIRGKTYEIYYSHQTSQLNTTSIASPPVTPASSLHHPMSIDYLHIGGTAPIINEPDLKTFISGGLGFSYLNPDITGTTSDLRLSLSIGLGLKYPVTDNIALRLETRALGTLFNNSSAIFCNGGCTLTVDGDFLLQAEVFAGVALTF